MNKRIFRQIALTVIATAVFNQAHAIGNGFYLGLMLGPATNGGAEQQAQVDRTDVIQLTPVHPRSSQFGARVFMGNQFSQYAAAEFGLDFFSTIRYDSRQVKTLGEVSSRVRAADLVIKGILPLSYFSVFAKGGVAMTYVTTGGALKPTIVTPPPPASPYVKSQGVYTNKFSGVYGIGASYDINQSWVVDLTYTTIQVGSRVGSVTAYALGLSYHFTDKYCGQFLCDD